MRNEGRRERGRLGMEREEERKRRMEEEYR